jgi:NADPH-dependent F420 reductase
MKITVIGSGNVGQALGTSWARKGHQVTFGTRDPESDKIKRLLAEAGSNARASSQPQSAAQAEMVVLATPWNATRQIIESLGDLSGKIVVDCTNPIGPGLQLTLGTTTSGGEQVAVWAEGARVVKAFNTTGAENMADPVYHGQSTTMFICGDEAEAKAAVTQLAEDLGFDVADVGGLAMARNLEPLALVWISLANIQGWGRNIALKIVKR